MNSENGHISIDSAWTQLDGQYHYFYNISLDVEDSISKFKEFMQELFGCPGDRWEYAQHRHGITVCFANQDDAVFFKLVN